MFMQRRCLHCMRRSYKIRMSWHPIRASNILSQTFNATSVYLLCYTNKLYFHWIRLPGDLTHLTTSGCNILYYASQEMYPHFSRCKRKQFVLKLTSRISQESHATKITTLASLIRAQWPIL